MSQTAAKLNVEFGSSGVDGVKRDMDGINLKLGAIGAGLMVAGQKWTETITKPILGILTNAYMGAASFEQAVGKVESVYQGSAQGILDWSTQSANAFGMSRTAALDMVGTYGQIMQSQGMTIAQSDEYSRSLIGLAADMSAFTDRDISITSNAIRAALTGEYESLKNMGIVLKAAEVEQEALNIARAEGTEEITEAHRVQGRYNIIMRQTSVMHGQFEREATGASGSLARLKANFSNLTTNLGQVLIPIGTKVTNVLNNVVQALMNTPQWLQVVVVAVLALVAAIGPLMIGVGALAVGIAALPAAFAAVAAGATAFMAVLLPLLPIIAAVTIAIGALFLAYKNNFLGFGDLVDGAITKVGKFFGLIDDGPSSKTVDLAVETTADNAFDLWHVTKDGTIKHNTLDVQLTPTSDANVIKIVDPETGETSWSLDLSKSGDDSAWTVVESSRSESDPNLFYMKVSVDGKEMEGFYNQATREWSVIETEVKLDTAEAEKKTNWFKRQWNDMDGLLRHIGTLFKNIWLGDWDQIDWYVDLGFKALVDEFVEAAEIIWGWIENIGNAWSAAMNGGMAYLKWFNSEVLNRETGAQDTGHVANQGGTPTEATDYYYPVSNRERSLHQPSGSAYSDPYRPTEGGSAGIEQYQIPVNNMVAQLAQLHSIGGEVRTTMADLFGTVGEGQQPLQSLNSEFLNANTNIMATASTVPIYTGATQVADAATGAMASNMGTSFGEVASSALRNFTQMQLSASTQAESMRSAVAGKASDLRAAVTGSMSAMQLLTGLQMLNMRNSAVTQTSDMTSTVGLRIGAMQLLAGLKMSDMASGAKKSGASMNTGLTSWLAGAASRISLSMLAIVLSVRGMGSSGYDAGYYAGSQISAGFADGMGAYLNQIRAAGAAMVASASAAVIAKAMISSPSRLFRGHGKDSGKGYELGILDSVPGIARAVDQMFGFDPPPLGMSPAFTGGNQDRGHGGQVVHQTIVHNHNNAYILKSDEWAKAQDGIAKANAVYDHIASKSQYRKRVR